MLKNLLPKDIEVVGQKLNYSGSKKKKKSKGHGATKLL